MTSSFGNSTDIASPLPVASSPSTRARVFAAFWPFCLALVAWGSAALYQPPVVPRHAPADAFSADRAWRHVEAIARQPHPCGSEENRAVAEYLLAELRALGLEVQVQAATAVRDPRSPRVAVRNLVARKPGRANTKALMLVAHYDSAPLAPGAADDGAAVAALLETVRALNSGPPLRNDLIVLLTDGEELGMLGAKAFVAEHPWLRAVGLVCNFEARGSHGPVFMFETSPGHGRLIAELARAASPVYATSLAEFLYRRMPNDTDFSVFREAGLDGFNFAFIAGAEHYHQPSDSLASLDPRSLYHQGVLALALARHFGNRELPVPRAADTVHFNVIGPFLAHYPRRWALPGAVLLVAGAAAVLWRRRRTGMVRPAHALGATLVFTVTIMLSAAVGWWGAPCLAQAIGGGAALSLTGAATVLLVVGAYASLRCKLAACEAAVGVCLWWLLAAVAAALWLPEGSYLVFWPAALAWVLVPWVAGRTTVLAAVLSGLPGALAMTLFSPVLYQLTVAFPGSEPLVVLLAAPLLMLALPTLDALLPARWL
jgi:hypothetical protein